MLIHAVEPFCCRIYTGASQEAVKKCLNIHAIVINNSHTICTMSVKVYFLQHAPPPPKLQSRPFECGMDFKRGSPTQKNKKT